MNRQPSKGKLAIINSVIAILQQFVSVVAGFILPRLILTYYGSAFNGLISSISQVLSCIILLNGGVGGVTRAALYKSLKDRDNQKVSSIVSATEKYLHKIGVVFVVIVLVVSIIYPFGVKQEFPDAFFVSTLVIVLSITNFSQYFFALAFQTLLTADQKQYIHSLIQIACIILSTLFSAILIINRVDIRIIKLISAICFTIGSISIRQYTIRRYSLNLKTQPDFFAIKQRWHAFAHTLANYIHNNTDIVLLTVFSTSLEISVFAVYYLVLNGLKMLFEPINTSIESLFGNTNAQDTSEKLLYTFGLVERVIHISATSVFSVCSIMIVPFVMLYTQGVTDVNYHRFSFAIIASFAEYLYCMRIPYQALVQAFGHFKQTKNGAILEALINICLSVILVNRYGILGVAIGTLVAMCFRTIQYAIYAYRFLLKIPLITLFKQMFVSIGSFAITSVTLGYYINKIVVNSVIDWVLISAVVFTCVFILILITSFIIRPKDTKALIEYIRGVFEKLTNIKRYSH